MELKEEIDGLKEVMNDVARPKDGDQGIEISYPRPWESLRSCTKGATTNSNTAS